MLSISRSLTARVLRQALAAKCAITMLLVLPAALAGAAAAPADPVPLRWGFDDIGVRGQDCFNRGCLMKHPKAAQLLREFDFDLWVTWYPDGANTWGLEANRAHIRSLDAFARANHLHWVLNQLSNLWAGAAFACRDENGYDWFNRPDGRHYYQFPDVLLEELGRCSNLLGLLYDEAEHHQNNANGVPGHDVPAMYDPAGRRLEDAADGHAAAAVDVARHHGGFGLKLYTEQVFPVMFHGFARAGFTAGTKVLKEAWTPVYLACALGAAKQYGTEFWVSPDLWGVTGYPGHSAEEYRAALLAAYHLGADCIYTESLALDYGKPETKSLVSMTPDDYSVNELGRVAIWFRSTYVPAHPRYYRFQEVRPRVVVVRQEDGCWGQRSTNLPFAPDRLFGSKEWKSTPVTEAWIGLWHLLTRGVVPKDALAWWAYAQRPYQVLCPLDGVVVYDHHAGKDLLAPAEVIFLTGVGISPETRDAVALRVKDGVTCVALPHLLPAAVREKTGSAGEWADGKGLWVATEDFNAAHVEPRIRHILPQDQGIRYRFGNSEVRLRPVNGDMNRIAVTVE